MAAPKNPNTAAATEAVRRRGQETMAAKLHAAGWVAYSPEQIARMRAAGWVLPVQLCSWCPEPTHPDPRSHPGGHSSHQIVEDGSPVTP
jgi:hypothetical protein